jgi:hypothetical protein
VQCYFLWDEEHDAGAPAEFLLALLSSQASDSKVAVRKASVSLLTSFLLILRASDAPPALQADAMKRSRMMLQSLACDSMLSVRKAVIDAAGNLASIAPLDQEVAAAWAGVVFPMVQDAEMSVQEAVQAEVRNSLAALVITAERIKSACELACFAGVHAAVALCSAVNHLQAMHGFRCARLVQMWKKLLEPTLKLQLNASHPTEAALGTLRMLRCRIDAISATNPALRTCLQKGCEGLKAKLKPGPMCAALQKLLTGTPLPD